MSSEILISSDPWENRVAILEDGELAELYIEREEKVIGSIFKGKVQNVLPGMGAAFVDVPNSGVALAVNEVAREKNKVFIVSGAASSDLTGPKCSPDTIHWTYDT